MHRHELTRIGENFLGCGDVNKFLFCCFFSHLVTLVVVRMPFLCLFSKINLKQQIYYIIVTLNEN